MWKNWLSLLSSSGAETEFKRGEGGFDEAGAGGEVAGETVGAEAVAVGLEVKGGGELVGGFGGGKVEVIVETEGLDGEGRVVGEDADGVLS